ncbi:hypothetical protein BK687P3_00027 [Bacteroides phage BK687P3]|nr:hypothetical protein BK687P3_00027 [Bacteroides phage BK687P3]
MGLKKYEIITVGSDKRVRALRSWAVGDRYVNIGDVGGIVYDEKTLSQDGACWLFRGNFGFPGARIGGDSIVDVGEAAIDANGSANVDILGSSVVVGSKVNFTVATGAVDGLILSEADFEQGGFNYAAGVNWEDMKTSSPNSIRTKSPIFAGGVPMILKCNVAGYTIQAFRLDRDGVSQFATAPTNTGEGVTLAIPACQYFVIRVMKNPASAITPADATTAKITFTGDYETKLSIIDSRLEINPVSSTGTVSIRSGGLYSIAPGAKYPDSVIRNSKVVINGHATDNRMVRLISDFIGCNVTIDATSGDSQGVGIYSNVNNLTFTGLVTNNWNVAARSIIQATDCDNFAVSPTIFPGLATAQTANMPFIFQGCNVPNGMFYHHVQIANTYKNIDFAKAQADLGKIVSGRPLVSSEVEGMYRQVSATGAMGPLIEAYSSVKSLNMANAAGAYGTTIYKDAYLNGLFDIAGTNVFGNTKKHDTQDVSGCKIVNTGETAVNMKGNIRVEGNATLTNASIIGTGYFGGNCVVSGVTVEGGAYVKDNAVIVVPAGSAAIRSLKMTENAYAAPASFTLNGHLWLSGNSRFTPTTAASGNGDLFMEDNAVISGSMSVSGSLTMKDNAAVGAGTLTVYGDVTVCGSYNQTVNKTWTGKRTITDINEPEYDNNVKTQYDF